MDQDGHGISVSAQTDGLLLQSGKSEHMSTMLIQYQTHRMMEYDLGLVHSAAHANYHGLVGLFTVAPLAFLLVVSERRQVAELHGHAIYIVRDVVAIPISSQLDAYHEMKRRQNDEHSRFKRNAIFAPKVFSSGKPYTPNLLPDESAVALPEVTMPQGCTITKSHIAEDVIMRRGRYGRLRSGGFKDQRWSCAQRYSQNTSKETYLLTKHVIPVEPRETCRSPSSQSAQARTDCPHPILVSRLVNRTKQLLTTRAFYFSNDIDISHRLAHNCIMKGGRHMHELFDPVYFWNAELLQPFINNGFGNFTLPLMQGFIDQKLVKVMPTLIESHDTPSDRLRHSETPSIVVTLVSRRNITRPGLRYARRGINHMGATANMVETEQLLTILLPASGSLLYAFTQIRGSIPLYFSQSALSLRPTPLLKHSTNVNAAALQCHFDGLRKRYGNVQIVSLVDKTGFERSIGEAYETHARLLSSTSSGVYDEVKFEWFDFHEICRGMRFDRASLLVNSLDNRLDSDGFTLQRDGILERVQGGIIRTNCMDCLDRTNLIQSAIAQRMLKQHLHHEGYTLHPSSDRAINELWADNGDAISRQYTSTAALKGDATRTGHRTYWGILIDCALSISRYFTNVVDDCFSQLLIDFLQGNVRWAILSDIWAGSEMTLRDPSYPLSRHRDDLVNEAISKAVAESDEDLLEASVFLCPTRTSTIWICSFEEVVIIITTRAIYKVYIDWIKDEVKLCQEIKIEDITGLKTGTYVTSTLEALQREQGRNVGVTIEHYGQYHTKIANINIGGCPASQAKQTLALKALPRDDLFENETRQCAASPEKDAVALLCLGISRAVSAQVVARPRITMVRGDIISLHEATHYAGLIESWAHGLRLIMWHLSARTSRWS